MQTTVRRVKRHGRVRHSAQERQELIEAYDGSGLSKVALCRDHGIAPATLYR